MQRRALKAQSDVRVSPGDTLDKGWNCSGVPVLISLKTHFGTQARETVFVTRFYSDAEIRVGLPAGSFYRA